MAKATARKVETVGDILDAAPIGMGHNKPPEPTPYEAARTRVADMQDEARLWLDGAEVESADQADGLAKILDDMRKARKQADDARKAENEPFDAGKAEVQARYNPLLKDADRVTDAVKAALVGWQNKQDAILRAAAAAERAKADEAARLAAKARATMDATNLAQVEAVEAATAASEAARRDAERAEKAKVIVKGGSRAVSFKTVFDAEIVDRRAALNHYARTRPDDLTAWVQMMADRDAMGAPGTVDGVVFTPRKVAA